MASSRSGRIDATSLIAAYLRPAKPVFWQPLPFPIAGRHPAESRRPESGFRTTLAEGEQVEQLQAGGEQPIGERVRDMLHHVIADLGIGFTKPYD